MTETYVEARGHARHGKVFFVFASVNWAVQSHAVRPKKNKQRVGSVFNVSSVRGK